MPKRMIATLPDHDITTHYLSAWGALSVEAAKDHGIAVTSLEGEKANRKNFESYVSKLPFNLVFLNGHGNETTVLGYRNEPIIVSGQNEDKLKSTITYSISCSSAKELGEASINAGAFAYVGYEQDFIFTLEEINSTRPLEDNAAKLFLNHTTLLMTALFKGATVSEAYEKARQSLWDSITVAESTGSRNILSWLIWDYYAFVAKGDMEKRL